MTNKNILIERGNRLRSLRKKTGLTRLAFAEQTGVSANTLKALELGDRELTPQKALLFSNLFASLFSISLGANAHEANFDFLYYGKKKGDPEGKNLIKDSNDSDIQDDIHSFRANSAYTVLEIPDDLMSPFYNEGDIVSGKKITNKNQFPRYQGHICIIETSKGDKILRRIIKSENKKITSCILNASASQGMNIVEEIEAHTIAQALWHWHLSEQVQPE